ncbi:MAG: hypothetical protein ACLUHE_02635 [Christensenellales bacterium]
MDGTTSEGVGTGWRMKRNRWPLASNAAETRKTQEKQKVKQRGEIVPRKKTFQKQELNIVYHMLAVFSFFLLAK